jgi:hypothetical protein
MRTGLRRELSDAGACPAASGEPVDDRSARLAAGAKLELVKSDEP